MILLHKKNLIFIGKVREESLYDIFFGDKMESYRNFDDFEACSKCELF